MDQVTRFLLIHFDPLRFTVGGLRVVEVIAELIECLDFVDLIAVGQSE